MLLIFEYTELLTKKKEYTELKQKKPKKIVSRCYEYYSLVFLLLLR